MSYIVQQRDIDILRQSNKNIIAKVELLNHNFKVIDSIEGNLIDDSYSVDSQSDIRRTCSLTLHVSDSSFFIGSNKKIWIDKYIRIYAGYIHQRSQETVWYLIGTFTFNDTNYSYDESSRNLSLSCSDLMCELNGNRGGKIEGLTITIIEGNYIRNVIISLLNDAGITKYNVEDIGKTIPYDLEYSAGVTYYEILKEIVSLYAGYEMLFDINGVFTIQAIPTNDGEVNVLDSSIINQLVINEEINITFNNIYNYIQIWGSVIDTDYYTQTSSSVNGITYTATYGETMTEMDNFGKYGVRIPITNGVNPTLDTNGLGAIPMVDDDGNSIAVGRLTANTDYVFKYRKTTNDLLLLGQYQVFGEAYDSNPDSPFTVTNLGYEIKNILSDGDYSNIYSDDLANQRARYEIYLATRMQDTISLSMVSIPWLDVNWKIGYTSYNFNTTNDYIISNISGSISSSTMSVTLTKFYPDYPNIT